MKRLGFERGLGDAEQHGHGFGGLAALLVDALVFLLEGEAVDLVAPEERGVAGLGDLHLAQHLADDDLDVLVGDLHALEAVDFLHFVDQVLLERLRPEDIEDVVRRHGAFGELLAFLHDVALEDDDVLVQRDEVLFLGAGLGVGDDDLALAADGAADLDDAIDLGDLGGVLRAAGFEELGHTRQTAGDVLGLGDLARGLGEQLCRPATFLSFADGDVRAGGNGVAGEDVLASSRPR